MYLRELRIRNFRKIEDIIDVRAAETVDALEGITHSDKTMLNQFIQEGVIDGVKVLDFVNLDEGEARKRAAK